LSVPAAEPGPDSPRSAVPPPCRIRVRVAGAVRGDTGVERRPRGRSTTPARAGGDQPARAGRRRPPGVARGRGARPDPVAGHSSTGGRDAGNVTGGARTHHTTGALRAHPVDAHPRYTDAVGARAGTVPDSELARHAHAEPECADARYGL